MSTTSRKRKIRRLIAILSLPGICLVAGGAVDFYWSWATIQNPVMVTGTVESAKKYFVRSSAGEGEEDRVRVSFPIANGETATHEASVGSRFFFSVGGPTRVRYNAADPKQAMITGFFGEPAEGSFFILFGAFWLAFPIGFALIPDVDPARKQELIDKLRAAQKRNEEE